MNEEYNLWQKLFQSKPFLRATGGLRYLFGGEQDKEEVGDLLNQDINKLADTTIGVTAPFRKGANILGQYYGSALTGKDMTQRENQGKFLSWLSEGLTEQEQESINERPVLEAIKSSAGMVSNLLPFASRVAPAANLLSRTGQIAGRGALEGLVGGFGYSREGRELEDTALGGALGVGGELVGNYLLDPSYRNMVNKGVVDMNTGTYQAALGDLAENDSNDIITVYRGVGGDQSGKNSYYGRGKYLAETKDVAEKYGKVSEYSLNKKDLFDTEQPFDEDFLALFTKKFSDRFGVNEGDVLKDLRLYGNFSGSSDMFYDDIKFAVKDFAENPSDKTVRRIIEAEEKVADMINETLREMGYKGIKASEIVGDRPTGEVIYNIFDESLVKAKTPTESAVPKTTRVWMKSKFSDSGAYADIPVMRREENITLYQGGRPGDKRQFWTPDKKYAEQFGNVREKTGTFYKVDNGNRVTDVYVEAPRGPGMGSTKEEIIEAARQAASERFPDEIFSPKGIDPGEGFVGGYVGGKRPRFADFKSYLDEDDLKTLLRMGRSVKNPIKGSDTPYTEILENLRRNGVRI